MSRKKVIEIHTYHEEEFMDALAERVAQKLRDQTDSTSSTNDSIALGGPCCLKTSTALDHFQVSRPTLKAMRERGEVEFMQLGREYRYNICR